MISIIIPIRNEENSIGATLDSILNQNIDEEIEILIADGMSTDQTRDILQSYQKQNKDIQIIDNPEKIVSTGFNRALSVSKGRLIIRIDGHSELQPDFLQNCIDVHLKVDVGCVGGPTIHKGKGLIGKSIEIAQSSNFGVGGVEFRKEQSEGKFVDTLAFGAYKRDVFQNLGGYDEELVRNQDDEFSLRMIQHGEKIWLDPSIQSEYVPRNSFVKLFKQYFQYGYYKIRVFQKRRGIASWRHLIPGIFVMSIITSMIIDLLYGSPILFPLVCFPYILLNILFTVKEFIKSPKKMISFLLLPWTFFILHISYGLGFILGNIYFWNKWSDFEVKDSFFNKNRFRIN